MIPAWINTWMHSVSRQALNDSQQVITQSQVSPVVKLKFVHASRFGGGPLPQLTPGETVMTTETNKTRMRESKLIQER